MKIADVCGVIEAFEPGPDGLASKSRELKLPGLPLGWEGIFAMMARNCAAPIYRDSFFGACGVAAYNTAAPPIAPRTTATPVTGRINPPRLARRTRLEFEQSLGVAAQDQIALILG